MIQLNLHNISYTVSGKMEWRGGGLATHPHKSWAPLLPSYSQRTTELLTAHARIRISKQWTESLL